MLHFIKNTENLVSSRFSTPKSSKSFKRETKIKPYSWLKNKKNYFKLFHVKVEVNVALIPYVRKFKTKICF